MAIYNTAKKCLNCATAGIFYRTEPSRKTEGSRYCNTCQRLKMHASHAKTYKKYKEKYRLKYTQTRINLKVKVFTIFGNKCACCGEVEFRFLTLDHINNDGNKHVHKSGYRIQGSNLYQEILRDIPAAKKKFQLLCWNCNCTKAVYQICPHQEKLRMVA